MTAHLRCEGLTAARGIVPLSRTNGWQVQAERSPRRVASRAAEVPGGLKEDAQPVGVRPLAEDFCGVVLHRHDGGGVATERSHDLCARYLSCS